MIKEAITVGKPFIKMAAIHDELAKVLCWSVVCWSAISSTIVSDHNSPS
jgi:hypothetical protein